MATLTAESCVSSDHLIQPPDTNWEFWRCVCVRGAGFPANGVLQLAGPPELIAASNCFMEAQQQAETAQENSLRQINAALDGLRSAGHWEDKKARKALLDVKRAVSEKKIPRSIPEPLADVIKEFERALRQRDESWRNFNEVFSRSESYTSATIRGIAERPAFREALVWQNRAAVRTAIDPLMRDMARGGVRSSRQRQHEELVASYWQRYCAKNDTIGFFGPVGWASFVSDGTPVLVRPGTQLVTARKVYWEAWAIEALGDAIENKYDVRQWIAPIAMPFIRVGNTVFYHPAFGPVRISSREAALIRACNGRDTAVQIAEGILRLPAGRGLAQGDVYRILNDLAAKGIIFWKFNIPMGPSPELALQAALQRIEDAEVRRSATEMFQELESARLAVEASAGNPRELNEAFDRLEQVFSSTTGSAAIRNQGRIYAGRTLVYEDCRRDAEILLGPELLRCIAAPLSLLLDSSRWLSEQIAGIYGQKSIEIHREFVRSTGNKAVDAAQLWAKGMPLFFERSSEIVTPLQLEFQRKWDTVLQTGKVSGSMQYSSDELREQVAQEFPAKGPGWTAARYHSPDIMIAADGEEAIRQGDYLLVMGEMHVTKNTLDASLFVNQHPHPDQLLSAVETDLNLQVAPIPSKGEEMGCRTTPSLVGRNSLRLEYLPDSFATDRDRAIPLSSITLENENDQLIARTRDGRIRMNWIDLVGPLLSTLVIDCFKISAPRAHTPRIAIDRLVIKRESWCFAPSALEFAVRSTQAERFQGARDLARRHGIPRFAFFKVPVEAKPAYVDFESPILVEIFAKMIRRTLDAGLVDGRVDISEMLPRPDQAWLSDANGEKYTSELRIVAVDSKGLSS